MVVIFVTFFLVALSSGQDWEAPSSELSQNPRSAKVPYMVNL
jgi:hypothetical protein